MSLPRVVLATAAVLTLTATTAAAQAPIRIGASLSLTGTYAKPGRYVHEGYKLCQKEVNDKGGLLGRKIDIVVYDDRSDGQTAIRLYEKLITEDKVDAVISPYSSPITEAVANVTEKYKKVMVVTGASATSIFRKGRRYLAMMPSPAESYLEGLIDLGAKNGMKTIAIINEDTLFAKAAAAGAAELAKKKGMHVVLQESYPKGFTDFSALLAKVKAANPDVLAASTYFDDAVAVARQMKELNVNPRLFGVTVGGDLPEFYDLLKQTAEYVYGASHWEEALPYPGMKEFVAAYRKEYNHEPVYHSAQSYAGCLLYVDAAKRAGSLDSDKVRELLLGLKTRTVYGDYQVDQTGFQIGHRMVTFQWQDGKRVIVWPDELATGKPRLSTPPWTQR